MGSHCLLSDIDLVRVAERKIYVFLTFLSIDRKKLQSINVTEGRLLSWGSYIALSYDAYSHYLIQSLAISLECSFRIFFCKKKFVGAHFGVLFFSVCMFLGKTNHCAPPPPICRGYEICHTNLPLLNSHDSFSSCISWQFFKPHMPVQFFCCTAQGAASFNGNG